MASVRDLLNRIRGAKQRLIDEREADALRIANDQVALLKNRIQSSGVSASGNPFADYSEQYAEKRKTGGYQIDFVDFTVTGQMWANVRAQVVRSNVFSCTVEIAGANERARNIINGAAGKRGNILEPTADELQILRDLNRERILSKFRF